jgi:hypothetical protein
LAKLSQAQPWAGSTTQLRTFAIELIRQPIFSPKFIFVFPKIISVINAAFVIIGSAL